MSYGATPDQWRHFADVLGLTEHLLPVVSNPNAVIAQRSTLRTLGKTPSVYDRYGEVVGLGDWTTRTSTPDDVRRWSAQADYGICIQARAIRAIDIDVADVALADRIEAAVISALGGVALPRRYRDNSGKRLLAYRIEGSRPKRVIPVDGGIVEFLGDGQQFIAAGTHDSGVAYLWDTLGDPPTLTEDEFNAVWSMLVTLFATGDPKIARQRDRGPRLDVAQTTDDLGNWLVDNWEVYDTGRSGELYLRCPFAGNHTTDSNETSTAYFLAGTGGYERGHWVCLHAHCMGRVDHDFTAATGYIGSGFVALPDEVPSAPSTTAAQQTISFGLDGSAYVELACIDEPASAMPPLTRDIGGKIEATADNLQKMARRPDIVMMHIAFDTFHGKIVWLPWGADVEASPWLPFGDGDYLRLRVMLERRNVKPVGQEQLRSVVHFAARARAIDSAQVWLDSLTWDGVPRVRGFCRDYLGCADTPYNDAVSRYWWTAMAGRVLSPGCQADMAPILYGEQGQRKTSAIKAMVPSDDCYTDIDMSERDDNLSRKLRGKLVGELEELRGLRSRDSEAIKAWLTRTHEEWVPKYFEHGTKFARRLVFVGTTNQGEMLADATGERRWLPTDTGVAGPIRVEAIRADRDQLWAEARLMFRLDGVDWSDAERLAKMEHGRYKDRDPWEPNIEGWLNTATLAGEMPRDRLSGVGLAITEIAIGALGKSAKDVGYADKVRITRVMSGLGFVQVRGMWVSRS